MNGTPAVFLPEEIQLQSYILAQNRAKELRFLCRVVRLAHHHGVRRRQRRIASVVRESSFDICLDPLHRDRSDNFFFERNLGVENNSRESHACPLHQTKVLRGPISRAVEPMTFPQLTTTVRAPSALAEYHASTLDIEQSTLLPRMPA